MVKNTLFVAAVLASAAFSAHAGQFDGINDADGNGSYSLEEVQAVVPDFGADEFEALDTDASGELSAEELAAAE